MGKTSAKIQFTKVPGVSGYEIRYGTGFFWYYRAKKVTVSKSASTKQIKHLSRNRSYGFDMRAYKKVGKKKYYSAWSNCANKMTK